MFSKFDKEENNNIVPMNEEVSPVAIGSLTSGMSRITFPQAGKKNSTITNRLKNLSEKKRDPISDEFWSRVPGNAVARAKAHVEDVIAVETREGGEQVDFFEFIVLKFLPVTSLSKYVKGQNGRNVKRGGRAMWKVDPVTGMQINGEGGAIVCSSADGVAPWVNHVGTNPPFRNEMNAPYLARIGRNVPIGFSLDGEQLPAAIMCDECPFNQWVDGKKPQCGQQHKSIVYLPPQADMHNAVMSGRLAVIDGAYSIQNALTGSKAGAKGGHATLDLPDFDKLWHAKKGPTKLTPSIDFDLSQYASVSGFAAHDDMLRLLEGEGFLEVQTPFESAEELAYYMEHLPEGSDLDAVRFIQTQEYRYDYAPDGLNGKIFPMEFMTGINNNKDYPQRIPITTVKAEYPPLSEKVKADFLEAKQKGEEIRKRWWQQAEENAVLVAEKLRKPDITVSEGPVEELPMSVPTDD